MPRAVGIWSAGLAAILLAAFASPWFQPGATARGESAGYRPLDPVRRLQGADWRMEGLHKVVGDGVAFRAGIWASTAELHGLPVMGFRFTPWKQLELRGLRVTVEGKDGIAGTSSAILDAFGGGSLVGAVADVVVHGIDISHPDPDPGKACSISASSARWAPRRAAGGSTLALQGDVRLTIGAAEWSLAEATVRFRGDGIEIQQGKRGVAESGGKDLSGPLPFCRVVS